MEDSKIKISIKPIAESNIDGFGKLLLNLKGNKHSIDLTSIGSEFKMPVPIDCEQGKFIAYTLVRIKDIKYVDTFHDNMYVLEYLYTKDKIEEQILQSELVDKIIKYNFKKEGK